VSFDRPWLDRPPLYRAKRAPELIPRTELNFFHTPKFSALLRFWTGFPAM
jgi:hypothetical protein